MPPGNLKNSKNVHSRLHQRSLEHAVCGWESQNMQCVCVCCSFRSPQAGCLTNSVSGSHEVCQFFFNRAWFVQYLDLCVCAHTASLNGDWDEL